MKHRTKPRRKRPGHNLIVWLSEELIAVFEEGRAVSRRTIVAELTVILEEHFIRDGRWPPKQR